jgi:hypothetical protein
MIWLPFSTPIIEFRLDRKSFASVFRKGFQRRGRAPGSGQAGGIWSFELPHSACAGAPTLRRSSAPRWVIPGASLLSGSLLPCESGTRDIALQCLEHARQHSSSRSAVRHLLRHFPDPGCELSREPQTLRGGQQQASNQACYEAPEQKQDSRQQFPHRIYSG